LKKWKRKLLEDANRDHSKLKRVLWTEDGSLTVLMEWLTTDGNYDKYVGVDVQREAIRWKLRA